MANKTFNTRVKNKRDTAANWEAVATTFQPLDGELIIVDTSAGKTRFKVGRYDTAKGRLLYYNEIPFADEYLYNDLNESQGKIYDKLKGIDDKSIIEMTLESVFDNTKFVNYRIGLWQFPKTGFYKLNIAKRGTTATQLFLYAQKTKEDGTTPEDPFSQDNLLRISPLTGDKQVESVFVQVDYTDTDTLTVYKVQFLNVMTFPGTININTYNKTTQKWDFTSVTESSAKWANNATQVSNALTLTKGDTTTKFDGSTVQTVEIPTKTSELTNDSFVSYAEQTLTEDQQNQAKTNLGIDVLTGNTTTVTPTQVKEAILAGRPVAITYVDNTYGNLLFTSFGYSLENNVVVANLVSTYYTQYILADLVGMSNNDQWNLNTTELGTSTDIDNLKLNMINNYVKYSEAQTLTDGQKAQARTNIGAISEADLVQPDWNQNDATAKDYIKNRICYEKETVTELGNTVEVWVSLVGEEASTSVLKLLDIPISYKIKGVLYENQKPSKMENYVMYYGERYGENPEYVMINTYSPHNMSFNGMEASDFQFVKIENTVKQIDSKFIHTLDTIAEQPGDTTPVNSNAVMSQLGMLAEEIINSFVCVSSDQSFNENQKQTARNNIGIKNPFKVTFTRSYGKVSADKTAKEIKDAANNGQFVYGIFDGDPANIYTLSVSYQNDIRFNRLYTETNSNMGLCYNVFYINDPTDDFKGNYEETYCYNITNPSVRVVKVILDNGTYKFGSTGAGTSYNEIFGMCNTCNDTHYTNSDVFIEYGNKLYKLDQNPWSAIDPLVFKRVSYDSTTSSILFETFTVNTDSTITYESNVFKQSSTQSDWNQNNTTASDYIKNRPGGYYSVVNSVDSGTLTTTDFADLSSEGSGITGYTVPNETFNTALQNLNVTAGKTYKISWVDNGQAFSYISEAVDLVKTEGSVTYHNICIFGDTIVNLTAAELIWGKTAKVIFLSNSVATATNTVTNVKVEEVNVVKIPKALVESDSIEEFDLSNNYTATNKGSIKYIKTDRQDSTTHYALLGFENEGNLYPKLKVSGQELDTSYVNTTEYSSGSIKSSWVDHSETGDTFIHGIDINHDRYNKALILQSELLDNTTEDLSVRGIATPTADNDAVNKKYVDDVKNDVAANYVKFTAEQTLTDEQKALARENINAPSPADAVYTATASSTDGVAYTATVSGIDSLTVGASFIMIPNKASTSKAPTLNVNGLGAKPIRRRLSSITTSLQQGYSTNWIALNKPFTVVYDGTAWVIEGLTKTDGADVYGAVAQATADAKGNNIADTYATIAMLQSLLPKVTTITLTSNWVGDASPYYQDIALSCVTETSIVDLQPTPEQLNSWQDDGIAFTTLSGNGTVRVYVAGGKPSSAISVQIRVQEVTVI